MLIYGTGGKIIKDGTIRNVTCSACKNDTSLQYTVTAKYFHLYWIPVFPYKRQSTVTCHTCADTFMLKDLSQKVQDKFAREKENSGSARFPVWMFSGLILIVGLIGMAFYSSNKTENTELGYIDQPEVGDIYSVELDSTNHYSTVRVDRVTPDSVFATENNYETDKLNGIYEINKPENYTDLKTAYSRSDLRKLYNEKIIYSIDR